MITKEAISKMIDQLDCRAVKIIDSKGNLLFESDQLATSKECADAFENACEFVSAYGVVTVHAANDSQQKQHWKTPYKWQCRLSEQQLQPRIGQPVVQAAAAPSFSSQLIEMLTVMKTLNEISGVNNSSNIDLQLRLRDLEHKHALENAQRANEDPEKYLKFIPVIKDLFNGGSAAPAPARISGTTLTTDTSQPPAAPAADWSNVPSLEQATQMSAEDLQRGCLEALQAMPDKIEGPKLYVMFRLMCAKPELVDKALEFHKLGVI